MASLNNTGILSVLLKLVSLGRENFFFSLSCLNLVFERSDNLFWFVISHTFNSLWVSVKTPKRYGRIFHFLWHWPRKMKKILTYTKIYCNSLLWSVMNNIFLNVSGIISIHTIEFFVLQIRSSWFGVIHTSPVDFSWRQRIYFNPLSLGT